MAVLLHQENATVAGALMPNELHGRDFTPA